VRVDGTTILDIVEGDPSGKNVDHLCFLVAPGDVQAIVDAGRLDVGTGPVPRSGAQGVGTSVYVSDPDGNLLELKEYATGSAAASGAQ
jgi:catechol 2,3-dioxygenase-like lactoylglutathione lyase family enzyme